MIFRNTKYCILIILAASIGTVTVLSYSDIHRANSTFIQRLWGCSHGKLLSSWERARTNRLSNHCLLRDYKTGFRVKFLFSPRAQLQVLRQRLISRVIERNWDRYLQPAAED